MVSAGPPATAELSVVIPTYGREDLCHEAIRSVDVVRRSTGLDIELIVVEQGDEPAYRIPDGFRGLWFFSEVKGTSYARNVGLDHASTPIVMFLDDDAALLDGVAEMLDEMRSTGAVMVTGRMVAPDGTFARGATSPSAIRARTVFHLFVEPAALWDVDAMRSVGGFDERFGPPNELGAEEGADLVSRLAPLGRPMRHVPIDVVRHPALSLSPPDKAARYGSGAMGVLVLSPSWWSLVYVGLSGLRRLAGLARSVVGRDAEGVRHRRAWLRGYVVGIRRARAVRRVPARRPHRPIVDRMVDLDG